MIHTFDIDQNFWDIYPDFKIAMSFKNLYKSDKTRGKDKSSKLMWFVAYTTDMNSKFYKLSQDERFVTIGEDYLDNANFYYNNKEEIDILIEDYIKLQFSAGQKQLRDWEIKSDERREFINKTPYNEQTFEFLDKMAANTSKIFSDLIAIKDKLAKEDGEGSVKGGALASLND